MSKRHDDLIAFLDSESRFVHVAVERVAGSAPREAGTWMLVSPDATFGTIGGGQLEFMSIDKARQLLCDDKRDAVRLDVPLGPEIGQCCGGRVEVSLSRLDAAGRRALLDLVAREEGAVSRVYIFGGGHVGHALAAALVLLPVKVVVVDTRPDAVEGLPPGVEVLVTPVPEEAVRSAPSGSAFLVLTHDHALDFMIVAEALARNDAAYVGMIGSLTKKAVFRNWYLREAGGSEARFANLVSPIGGSAVRDKRPAVIAAFAAAEVFAAVAAWHQMADA